MPYARLVNKAVETFKKNLPEIRKRNEEKGLWFPLNRLDDVEIYYRNVASFTVESLRLYGDLINISDFEIGQGKGKFTIDHKFSKKEGFLNNIPPEIIGSIINLEVLEHSVNSGKGSKCSITKDLLYNKYKEFKKIKGNYENKSNQTNKNEGTNSAL